MGSLCVSQAGHSRSVTVAAAYLMRKHELTVTGAMGRLNNVMETAINPAFAEQLQLYERCANEISEQSPEYRRWKFQFLHGLSAVNFASSAGVEFSKVEISPKGTQIRCKKCRFVLASEKDIIYHEPKVENGRATQQITDNSLVSPNCAHFFLEPIRWMKLELDRGELDGRFNCPKCRAKVGNYAWQGMTCSCRIWVLPALCLQRSKVDEVKQKLR